MMSRFRMLILLAALGAIPSAFGAVAPPSVLIPFIHGGSFDPGDYSFVRGAFPGATAQQGADWKAIEAYGKACVHEAALTQDVKLEKLGIKASVPEDRGYQDRLCSQILNGVEAANDFKTFETFHTALFKSLPYCQVYEAGITASTNAIHGTGQNTLEEEATARIIPDQAWRSPLGTGSLDSLSGVDADTLKMLKNRMLEALTDVDWNNSHWVRDLLDKNGWSTTIQAGPRAANMVWLMVQHADDDPAFQTRALRQLAPYARAGKFSKPDYALLTDRVMLATTGKQHYGSQLSCQNHHYAPFSLDAGGENPKTLDKRRAEMGLFSEATYLTYLPSHC
ncbi:hypothetical protein HKD21_09560 [Gluconobacter cerevisiae]|uniref:Uncharacterized protein n=1 Tax=Gluconobacter cerevisiae TaxID=1379734 RepID=A0ABR9YEQ2_9PROT|nr:DUF6624 domain-containing protein [Gluconobacter cerevisiae]MBF0877094.1 hypothetical protein [Gluconobacter cerevisiae]